MNGKGDWIFVVLGLIVVAFCGMAHAQQGRSAVLQACPPEKASCWSSAQRFERFAAPSGEHSGPVAGVVDGLDVRIGHHEGSLVVRVKALPSDSWLEVGVRSAEARLRSSSWGVAKEGWTEIVVDEAIESGSRAELTLMLVGEDGDGGRWVWPWAPFGPGDPVRPFPVAFTKEAPLGFPMVVTVEGGTLGVQAPGADDVEAKMERMLYPQNSRGTPEPWQERGQGGLQVALPNDTGWMTVTGVWKDAEGAVLDMQTQRVFVEAPPVDGLQAFGIHPAPKWTQQTRGGTLRLQSDATISVSNPDWLEAADLLAEEVKRLSGVQLQVVEAEGDIQFVSLQDMRFPPAATKSLQGDEAFGLRVWARGAVVGARTLRGAVYGALALADALGVDGEAPGFRAADRPDLEERILLHSINTRHWPTFGPEIYRVFLRRVVARGRYNKLVLSPSNSLQYESHPEIAHPRAMSRADLEQIIADGRAVGLEVIPGANSPGHASWFTTSHPELQEDTNGKLACTRHPDLRPLLTDLYTELMQVFGSPTEFHIGHDEIIWTTDRLFGDERCPRCAGTPRWALLEADLRWHVQFFEQRGVRPWAWTDMFLAGWNGARAGTDRVFDDEPEWWKERISFMSWSQLGNSVQRFGKQGYALARVHTGYLDWKRENLTSQAPFIVGEGLGLFTPAPWSGFGPPAGTRALHYHWPSVLLAGTTAWRNDLADSSIGATLRQLEGEAGFLPGLSGGFGSSGAIKRPRGASTRPTGLDKNVQVGSVQFQAKELVRLDEGNGLQLDVGDVVAGISLLQATTVSHVERNVLQRDMNRNGYGPEAAVVKMVVHYEDGQEVSVPLYFGRDTYRPDGGTRAGMMWGTAGSVEIDGYMGEGSGVQDHHLYRWDWLNPRLDVSITTLELQVQRPGVTWWVAGASKLDEL